MKSGMLLWCVFWSASAAAASVTQLPVIRVSADTVTGLSQGVISPKSTFPLLRSADLLETVPGMVVTQHSGDGKANQYFFRGYNLDHGTDFATSIENVPVNMPSHAHGQGYTDLNPLIPELVKSLHYRKGPYYPENGDFSATGSASIAYHDHLPDGDQVGLGLGSYGYRRMLLMVDSVDHHSRVSSSTTPVLLGAFELMENQGPWQVPENLKRRNGVLGLSSRGGDREWKVSAGDYHASWNATDQIPLAAIDTGSMERFAAVDATDGGDSQRSYMSGYYLRPLHNGYRRASAFVQSGHLNLWSNFTYFLDRPEQGDQFLQRESRRIAGLDLSRSWAGSLGRVPGQLTLGVQARQDRISLGLYNTAARAITDALAEDTVRLGEGGVYVSHMADWRTWLQTTLGLRYQKVWMGLDDQLAGQSFSRTADMLAPKFGLAIKPWSHTQFFYSYGQGFHSNDVRGVFYRTTAAGDTLEAAPPLVAAYGQEVGFRSRRGPVQGSLALWQLRNDSELVYVADAGGTEARGSSKRYGLETLLRWQLIPAVGLELNYAWLHARYRQWDATDPGFYIPNAVSRTGRVQLDWHSPNQKWGATLDTRYIGPYPLSRDNSLHTPSSIITNAGITYRPVHRLSFQLAVLNLFNRRYYDIAYGQDYRLTPDSEAVLGGITVHPGEPLQLRGSISYYF